MAKHPKEKKDPKVITDLIPDARNINRGTEEGAELIDKSIEEAGFGRSIVIDKDNKIIAGNKMVEAAARKGREKIKVVETNGDELVVVKRNDLTLDSVKGTKLKIMDNTTHKKNYLQDAEVSEALCSELNLNQGLYGLDELQGGPTGTIKKTPVQAFKKSHLLISFLPAQMVHIQAIVEKLSKIDGIEIEQSSN